MPKDKDINEEIEKEKHHASHIESYYGPKSMAHETAKHSHKKIMIAHMALWITFLMIFIVFIVSALISIFTFLKVK